MSLKKTDVRTPGIAAIAKKWNLPVAKVAELVNIGAKVEFEHNKNINKARQVARDHINERPDYYQKLKKMEKTPVSMKEETGVGGVRGLGYTSGDPAGTDYVQQYIDTNSMSYTDFNGSKLDYFKKKHTDLHNKALGFNFFDPTNIKNNKNSINEGISAGPERSSDYSIGDPGGGRTLYRPLDVKEGAKIDKAKKVAMAGITAANMYTMADVAGRASEGGHGSPKADIVRAASALPGAAGWGATAVHYGKKGYDLARDALKKKKANMEEEKKMPNPCWKGYKAYGMKKKNGKEVPNCVPVEEQSTTKGDVMPKVGGAERGIYEKRLTPAETKKKEEIVMSMKKGLPGMKKRYGERAKEVLYATATKRAKQVAEESDAADETNMAKTQLKAMSSKANNLQSKLKSPKNLPGWVQSKIAVAKDGITAVDDYMTHSDKIDESAAWQRKEGKNPEGGLNRKGIASYRRENPGSKLSMAVTTKPSKLKPGSKAANRRKSFCARMGGMPGPMKDEKGRPTRKALSLRKWNCEESVINELRAETLGSYVKKAAASRKKSLEGTKADIKTWGKRQKGITTAIKQLTKENSLDEQQFNLNKPDVSLERSTYKEETTMDNNNLINEAIENILENNLNEMKENLMTALQEKAQEKLEERKKIIAANYFAQ